MEQKRIQNLPLGTSDFSALRVADEIYVDKTEFIYELASQKAKYLSSLDDEELEGQRMGAV